MGRVHSAAMSGRRRRNRRGPRAPKAPTAEEVLRPVALDLDRPADEPLEPAEAAEMVQHLKFLAEFRKPLRLRVNAAEDLMLNGSKPPTERGLCKHLLSKVDKAAVDGALERISSPRERSRLLGSVVRFSDDPGFLVAYLESLQDGASRREAAGAFGLATARLDFEELGESKMKRLLDTVAQTFEGPERAQVLFGLLQNDGFRAAWESVEGHLPKDLAKALKPLVAAHAWVIEGREDGVDTRDLQAGAALLLDAPADVLTSYPAPVQQRLLERAVELMASEEVADRASAALLEGLPHDGDAYRELALIRAAGLLRQGADARAKWLLRQLHQAQPKHPEAKRMLEALRAPRLGTFTLGWPGGEKVTSAKANQWTPGFWLAEQKKVWLRAAPGKDELALWDTLVGPGFAVVLSSGGGKAAHLAFSGRAVPMVFSRAPSVEDRIDVALQAVLILESLAARGLALPDAKQKRFLLDGKPRPRLLLADASGVSSMDPADARKKLSGAAFGFAREVLRGVDLPPTLARAVFGRRSRPGQLRRALALHLTP